MPKPRIYVAVGHGVRPDGTYDPGAGGEWDEQTAGDVIVAEMARVLRLHMPDDDVYDEAHKKDPNYKGSPGDADDWGATHVIAVHHDWSLGIPAMFGFWISTEGRHWADAIRDRVVAAGFPHRKDWHKYRGNLGLLNSSERRGMVAALIEVGKIGQDDIDTDDERRAMGRALAYGTLDHLGIDTTTPPRRDPPPAPTPPPSEEDELMAIRIPDRFKPGSTLSLEDTLALMRDDTKHARQFAADARRDAAIARELTEREARAGTKLTATQVDEIVQRVTKATADG